MKKAIAMADNCIDVYYRMDRYYLTGRLIGRFIEKERLYISSLVVRHLHPYSELGYGVTTRLMTDNKGTDV